MCMSVPGRVMEVSDDRRSARVEVAGVPRTVNLGLLDETHLLEVGDHVLVQLGLALQKLDPQEARELEQVLEEFSQTLEELAGAEPAEVCAADPPSHEEQTVECGGGSG